MLWYHVHVRIDTQTHVHIDTDTLLSFRMQILAYFLKFKIS